MKRIISILYSVFVGLLCVSFVFAGGIPGTFPNMPPRAPWEKHGLIFNYDPSRNISKDLVSRIALTQTYTGTNRTRINSAGLLETVAANTPVIDHVGTSLTPVLRVEPKVANILLGTPPTTQDITLGLGAFTLQVFGAGTAAAAGNTATITGAGTASSGTPVTFTVTVGGTVTITITTATVVWLVPGSIPSSYFAGAAAIGAELVVDGGFADVIDDTGELSSGTFTVGNCYKISAHTGSDFTTVGAPDSNVGTYFNATATGAGVLDADDKAFPVTFRYWTVESGLIFAPQATAGSLTGKASVSNTSGSTKVAYQAVALSSSVNRYVSTATITSGSYAFRTEFDGTLASARHTATGTYYDYKIITGAYDNITLDFPTNSVMVLDDVSVKEHGTVRLSEANTVTLAMPAAVTAMLAAGTGTIVIKGRFAFARAAGVVTNVLASAAATNSLVYTTTAAGNITSNDGTTIAENTGAYTANTWWKIALKFPSDTNKYRIGIDVDGAGIVWGTEVAFDGDFTATANLIFGYVLHGPTWIQYAKAYNRVLTDAQINAM